nr:RHS repeat-associated core domain-containing protein [Xanthomonas arboricola]
MFSAPAKAQDGCDDQYVPLCASEALAYERATRDAAAYFAANPKNDYGDANKLCPTIKTKYNGPYVWAAGVPTIDRQCTEEGDGYNVPVFRAQFKVEPPPGLENPPVDPGKNNQCDATTGPTQVGNPLNLVTGYKTELAVDYVDRTGHLTLKRHYTSAQVAHNPSGTLGLGWRHGFQSGVMAYQSTEPRLVRPSGNSYAFTQLGSEGVFDKDVNERIAILTANGQPSGWRVDTQDDSAEYFDARGKLVRVEYKDGDILTLGYNADNQLIAVQDRKARALRFSYTGGKLISVLLPDGASVEYGYQGYRLTSVEHRSNTRAFAGMVRYTYEDETHPEFLTGIIDENGQRYAAWSYDQYGRAVTSRHGGKDSPIDLVTVSRQINKTSVTSPLGDVAEFGHTVQFSRAKIISSQKSCATCGGQSVQSRTYDANGYPDLNVDFLGITKDFDYDARGLLVQEVEASNNGQGHRRMLQTQWHPWFRVPAERRTYDAAGALVATTAWSYNSRGQPMTIIERGKANEQPRTFVIHYCEDADVSAGQCPLPGLVKELIRPGLSGPTTYLYFPKDDPTCISSTANCLHRKGDPRKITNALGQVTEYLAYDGAGRPLSIKDANGIITDYTYHPRGWLTASKVRGADASSEADDRVTRIDYWPTGLVKQVTQPDGAFTAFTYDAAHRLTDIADNAGNTVHYTLDNAGNRVKEDTKDATGTLKRTLSRVYNQLGQLKTHATAASDPTDFEYDANGNATKVTDALATATQSEYDPLNRLSRTLQDVAGIKANTTFDYDALDNLTKVTDPKGLDTKYEYNGFGDLVKLTSPDTGVTSYTYDSAGNRATQTDARGNTTAYGYDALNRLTKVTYPTTSLNVTYTYDVTQTVCMSGETFSIGRLTKMQDGGAITQYCYNRFGDLVRKVQTSNGKALVLRYDYTVGGQLRRMTYPDGAVVDYVRNTQGQTTEVGVTPTGGSRQVLLGNASYYPFGPAAGWTYGNGRTLARRYDLDYRPQAIQDPRPDGLEVGFGFDPAGNLTALMPAGNPTPEIGLGYDALGRLTGLKDGRTGTLIDGYSFDATGNRLSAKVGTATQAYTYPADSHRLSSVAGVARSYDATGNTTAIGGTARQYTYDTTGRMTQARRAGAVTMNYRYNGRGEQVRRFLGTTNTYTLYDEAGHWLGDYDTNGAPKQQAIWLDDLAVGLLASANKLHYIEPDHLGSPRVVIDPTRDVAVWTWSLKGEAFGNTAPNQDPDGDGAALVLDMRFPGQRYDAASGLNQNIHREYDAGTGRYSQSDPIGLDGGINAYSYAAAMPLTWIDRFGLAPNQGCVAAWVGTCSVVGGGIGYWGGGIIGGAGGTFVTPVAGTAGGFVAGSTLGGLGGASAGGLIGGLVGSATCPDDDEKEDCEKLLRVDTDTCTAITRRRGARAGAVCHASASQRYAACLRGDPIPTLNTWNN